MKTSEVYPAEFIAIWSTLTALVRAADHSVSCVSRSLAAEIFNKFVFTIDHCVRPVHGARAHLERLL